MKGINVKRTLLAVLLSALVGSAFAAGASKTDSNGSWSPYDRDSAAASPAQ
jgi:hypothetical protein